MNQTAFTPPPVAYNLKSEFMKGVQATGKSFGLSREHFRKVYLKENPPVDVDVPGPGAYKVRNAYTDKGS